MPLTWFAHQAAVLPLKLTRPTWFDATALCVGSMMPDLMYSFSGYIHIETHHWIPALVYGLPITVAMATIVRFVVAPVAAHQVPDLGPFQLHSYAVLARRRPAVPITLFSAILGIVSHIVLDTFTHPGRWGVRRLGYDDLAVQIAGFRRPLANVLQYVGHTLGSLIAVLLLWAIGRRRLLEEWYGPAAVARARDRSFSRGQRRAFWLFTLCGTLGGLAWRTSDYVDVIQRVAVATFAGAVVGSLVAGRVPRGDR